MLSARAGPRCRSASADRPPEKNLADFIDEFRQQLQADENVPAQRWKSFLVGGPQHHLLQSADARTRIAFITLMDEPSAESLLKRAWVALAKSGTITLELALAGVPMVVGYRIGRIEWEIGRRRVDVPSIVLTNLVAGERVVPELLQDEMTAERLANALSPLLAADGPARKNMLMAYARVRDRLGTPGCASRVAEHAVELLA